MFFDLTVLGDSAAYILDSVFTTFGRLFGPKADVLKKWRAEIH